MDDLLADLNARGLVHESTDQAALAARLGEGPMALYYGCDPTADSLHLGNLIGLLVLRRFQNAGHRPIALAGGATGMVGDPGGRSEERNLLDAETLSRNVAAIKEQISRVVELSEGGGALVDNRDWTAPITLLDFLRDVGKHVTVGQMIARDSVKNRLASAQGISYTEFSYMLLQANDYLWLHDNLDCVLQIGGSDQWGNLVSGVDLIRRARGAHVHALAWPLLLAPDGSKLGKTTGARTWLDSSKTSPYQFHQHFVNISDAEVVQQFPMLSLRPLTEVRALLAEHAPSPEKRVAQRALADEITEIVHGIDAARSAREAADVLFGGDPLVASAAAIDVLRREVPTTELSSEHFNDPVDVLVATSLASSKSEARRLLEQRGTKANGVSLGPEALLSDVPLLHNRFVLLRKGKSRYHLVEISRPGG